MSTLSPSAQTSSAFVYPQKSIAFLLLTDTPITYVDQAGKGIVVNSDETGLEFSAVSGGVPTFLLLTDAPDSYAGQASKVVQVNAAETGLEFVNPVVGSSLTSGNIVVGGGGSGIADSGVAISEIGVELDNNSVPRWKIDNTDIDIATVTSAGTATLAPGRKYYGTLTGTTTFVFSPAFATADSSIILSLLLTGQPWTLTYPTAVRNDANGSTTSVNITANKYIVIQFYKTGLGNIRMLDNIDSASAGGVSDAAYGPSWDGVTTVAGSKNALYDELHKIDSADDGTIVNAGTGFTIAGAAASGKILVGNGTNLVLSTPTFPNASATTGKVIKSDGTNWVASTETLAAPGTSGNVLTSDGTNWTSAVAPTGSVSDSVYNSGWNGNTTIAPSKNAIYDELHKIDTADDGTIVNAGTGFRIAGGAASGKILVGDGTNLVLSTPTFPNASATSGKFIRSDGTNWIASTPTLPTTAGTAGKALVSDGTNYIESTPTFPNASATSGKFIRSDGTNWIASTPTLPTSAGTAGKILTSDGTNYIETTPTFPNASATALKIIKSDGTNWVASTETYAVPGTTGNVLTSNGTNWTSAAPASTSDGWTQLSVITSDFTTTNLTATDITGLVSGTLSAATLYEVDIRIVCNSSDASGYKVAFHGGGTGSAAIILLIGGTAASSFNINTIDTLSAALGTNGNDNIMSLRGFFTSRSTGTPTMSFQIAKVTSGTATVRVGSNMRYRAATVA